MRVVLLVDIVSCALLCTDAVRPDYHPAQDIERPEQDAGRQPATGEYCCKLVRVDFVCLFVENCFFFRF